MAWLAVDADGTAYSYIKKPIRATDCWMPADDDNSDPEETPMSTVFLLTGKEVRWNNEPIEVI